MLRNHFLLPEPDDTLTAAQHEALARLARQGAGASVVSDGQGRVVLRGLLGLSPDTSAPEAEPAVAAVLEEIAAAHGGAILACIVGYELWPWLEACRTALGAEAALWRLGDAPQDMAMLARHLDRLGGLLHGAARMLRGAGLGLSAVAVFVAWALGAALGGVLAGPDACLAVVCLCCGVAEPHPVGSLFAMRCGCRPGGPHLCPRGHGGLCWTQLWLAVSALAAGDMPPEVDDADDATRRFLAPALPPGMPPLLTMDPVAAERLAVLALLLAGHTAWPVFATRCRDHALSERASGAGHSLAGADPPPLGEAVLAVAEPGPGRGDVVDYACRVARLEGALLGAWAHRALAQTSPRHGSAVALLEACLRRAAPGDAALPALMRTRQAPGLAASCVAVVLLADELGTLDRVASLLAPLAALGRTSIASWRAATGSGAGPWLLDIVLAAHNSQEEADVSALVAGLAGSLGPRPDPSSATEALCGAARLWASRHPPASTLRRLARAAHCMALSPPAAAEAAVQALPDEALQDIDVALLVQHSPGNGGRPAPALPLPTEACSLLGLPAASVAEAQAALDAAYQGAAAPRLSPGGWAATSTVFDEALALALDILFLNPGA